MPEWGTYKAGAVGCEGRRGNLADYLSNAWGVWTGVRVMVFLAPVHPHTARRNVSPAGSRQLFDNGKYEGEGVDTPETFMLGLFPI